MKQSCYPSHPSNNEKDFIVHCSLFIVHFFRLLLCCIILLPAFVACNDEDETQEIETPYEKDPSEEDPDYGLTVSGTTGTLTWEVKDSVLTISGTGAMPDYRSGNTVNIPWGHLKLLITTVIIGEGITNIGGSAFDTFDNLAKVTIPKTVTTINEDAFYDCRKLTSITIPEGVTRIGVNAFGGSGLITAELPNSLQIIESMAFLFCTDLTDLTIGPPGNLHTIGASAFSSCYSLSSFELPASMTAIGERAFYNCESLTSVKLPGGVKIIEKNAFYSCDNLVSVSIGEGLETIDDEAFNECLALTSLTLPEGLKRIGRRAFWRCGSLESVTLPESLTALEESAFQYCRRLKEITIPGGVSIIEKNAFQYCDDIARVAVSEGVTAIEEGAFAMCWSILWVSFPKSLTRIGPGAISVASTDEKAAEVYFPWEDLTPIDISGLTLRGSSSFNIILYVPVNTKFLYHTQYLGVYGLQFSGRITIIDGTEDIPDRLIDLGANLYLASRDVDPDAVMLKVGITNEQKNLLLQTNGYYSFINSIVRDVYARFDDDFDFIYAVLADDGVNNNLGFYAINLRVSNDVQGIGGGTYTSNNWGSAGKLKSVIYNPNGPMDILVHEIAHQWANRIVDTYDFNNSSADSHWGVTHLANNGEQSVLGGFQYVRTAGSAANGKTKYQASHSPETNPDGSFINGTWSGGVGYVTGCYSDIDLYLMGLKPAQELRTNNFRMDVFSDISFDAELEQGYFYASHVASYTIDDIIRLHGARNPDVSRSQKNFKILTLLLTTDVQSNSQNWQYEVKGLANEKYTTPGGFYSYTFYQATGGRATIEVQGISQSLKPQFRSLYYGN